MPVSHKQHIQVADLVRVNELHNVVEGSTEIRAAIVSHTLSFQELKLSFEFIFVIFYHAVIEKDELGRVLIGFLLVEVLLDAVFSAISYLAYEISHGATAVQNKVDIVVPLLPVQNLLEFILSDKHTNVHKSLLLRYLLVFDFPLPFA